MVRFTPPLVLRAGSVATAESSTVCFRFGFTCGRVVSPPQIE